VRELTESEKYERKLSVESGHYKALISTSLFIIKWAVICSAWIIAYTMLIMVIISRLS